MAQTALGFSANHRPSIAEIDLSVCGSWESGVDEVVADIWWKLSFELIGSHLGSSNYNLRAT